MKFQVGDQVVHWAYGPGEIIQMEERQLNGPALLYYVVQVGGLTIWVSLNEAENRGLRVPTPASEFSRLFDILRSVGEPLSDDRLQRKTILTERLRDGTLESVCRVIRDLSYLGHSKKLNESDKPIKERAENFLLVEWTLALKISTNEAQYKLERLLDEGWQLAQ
jgi:RNA polymerase-interacting CarD/CdnL/TRCF family regulator